MSCPAPGFLPFIRCPWHAKFAQWLCANACERKEQCAVLWGPVGCGKTHGARELFRRNSVRVVSVDGDEGVLANAQSRRALLDGILSERQRLPGQNGGTVFFFDDADGHGDGAGKFLSEFMSAAAKREKAGQPVPADSSRLVFVANDKYASHSGKLRLPFAGRVLHIDCKRMKEDDLAVLARQCAPKNALLSWQEQTDAASFLAANCGGDVRVLLRNARLGDVYRRSTASLNAFEVTQDFLTLPCTADTLPRFPALQGALQRTDAGLVKWLVHENLPAAFSQSNGWPQNSSASTGGRGGSPWQGQSELQTMAAVADALSAGDCFAAQHALPREYGHEYFSAYAPTLLVANARAAANGQRDVAQRKFQLPVKSQRKHNAKCARDVSNMGKAAIRQRVEALREGGKLVFCAPTYGPEHLKENEHFVAGRLAWAERDRLVARGTVEAWGGPGKLTCERSAPFLLTGTGCIAQSDAFDVFDVHAPERRERKFVPAASPHGPQKRAAEPGEELGGAKKKKTGKAARGKQLTLPRMFSLK